MKKLFFLTLIFPLTGYIATAQTGNVGVGTSSPQAKLDVNGDVRIGNVPLKTSNTMNVALDTATGQLVKQEGITKASGFVNAGVPVSLGNISVQVSTSGNRSLMIRMDSTATLSGASINNYHGGALSVGGASSTVTGYTRRSDSFAGGTFYRWQSSANFTHHGNIQTILFTDETNRYAYRATLIIGSGYVNNFVSIERL
ncbi:hypothetical protein Oweho_2003 [Owenweeksia hongkongensis DSM 17368]|uniref:Uncharacterized protein n=1 Tax=Owenweeksia hongkongensis (strain DSM 17368 / CIP 108786 / JCM 12287 / NRRL B-23963 / UST20020801) TaxID=926562 RepID=G8R2Y6_OWEHD|nr:hypothetical protein [Owenweeksia hongkongensis]AEV32980.1 hypothetical protein Oweho_2003 [Owenweeksia hongkongensis DSM 17368]